MPGVSHEHGGGTHREVTGVKESFSLLTDNVSFQVASYQVDKHHDDH